MEMSPWNLLDIEGHLSHKATLCLMFSIVWDPRNSRAEKEMEKHFFLF